MNNTNFNYMDPLICRFFSVAYTTVLQLCSWWNLQIGKNTERNCLHGGPSIYVDFQLCRGSVPYPRAVQGSTVLIKLNLHQKNFRLRWGLLARRALTRECSGDPGGSDSKESACSVGDPGSTPEFGRSPGERNITHSSILDWRIPWTEEPGGLQSITSWTWLNDSQWGLRLWNRRDRSRGGQRGWAGRTPGRGFSQPHCRLRNWDGHLELHKSWGQVSNFD